MSTKKPISHKEAKEPDAFISNTDVLIRFLQKNQKALIGLVSILIVIAAGSQVYKYNKEKKEMSANKAFYQVDRNYTKYNDEIKKIRDENDRLRQELNDKSKTKKGTKKVDQKKNKSTIVTNKEKIKKLKNQILELTPLFLSVAKKHAGTSGGTLSQITASHIQFENSNKKQALETLTFLDSSMPKDNFYQPLTKLKIGTLLQNEKSYEKSLAYFDQIIANKEAQFLHSEALLKKGISLQKLKKWQEAESTYTRASEEFSDSPSGKDAKKYLHYLKYEKVNAG